jgi:membrane fusion protein, heavy metal efflux system
MRYRLTSVTVSGIVAATVLVLVGCTGSSGPTEAAVAATAPAVPSDPFRIDATPELLERIQLGEAQWAAVGARISVAARVEVDETRLTRVGSPVMGRVNGLAVREGQNVTRGQLLATITSTGLSDAQLTFLKALSQTQLASRAVERADVLLKADVIGSAELQRRQAELTQAEAELAAARDQLRLLGVAADGIAALERTRELRSVARIEATMSGTVLDRTVAMGQVIQPADTIFEIADLSNLWLVASVPEQSAGTLRPGQQVDATLAAFPGETLRGRLSFVSSTVNPETRTVRVRMDVPNRHSRIKPAMLATMMIQDPTQQRLVIPSAAVVREGDSDFVFVERAKNQFFLTPVKLGEEQAGRRVLEEGLAPGVKIAVEGSFHLNNERRRRTQRGSAD